MDDFVTPAGCEALRALTAPERLAEAGLVGTTHTGGFAVELPIDGEPLLEALRDGLESLVGLASDVPYTVRFRRYLPGEGHRPHLDCYSVEGRELLATALLFLTDTPRGGETAFPRAQPSPLAFPPRQGQLLLWYNHLPNGDRDPLSFHAGLPVEEGIKEVMLYFFYKEPEYAAVRLTLPLASGETVR